MKIQELLSEGPIAKLGGAVGSAAKTTGKVAGVAQGAANRAASPSDMATGYQAGKQALQKTKDFFTGNWSGLAGGSGGSAQSKPAAKSPFDQLSSSDAKSILANVLNGKPLDQYQTAQLRKVYNRL